MTSSEPLINPPRQRRSQESLERVLTAGVQVLQERGFEGFTLQEVSRRAGVSIGAIYARTPSKEALLKALHERVMATASAQEQQIASDARRDGLAPRELIELLVHDMAEAMLGNANELRVFMRRAPIDEDIWQRGAEHSKDLAQIFESALRAHRAQLRHPDPELAIDIAYRFVYCTLARRITHGPSFESDRELSEELLVDELGRAAADYLLGSES